MYSLSCTKTTAFNKITVVASLILIHIFDICHVDLSGRVAPKITKLEFSQGVFHIKRKLNFSESRSFNKHFNIVIVDVDLISKINKNYTLVVIVILHLIKSGYLCVVVVN